MNDQNKSLLVCVGDVSADRHAARVISRVKELLPGISVWGVGGPEMEKVGIELMANCQQFATIGIIEPIKLLPFFAKLRSDILKEIETRKPEAVLLVDFGGFNIGLAQLIRPRFPKLPIIYFISPQVWASRPWRINVLKRCISKMLTIFPFEEGLYLSHGVPARFVGHPLSVLLEDGNPTAGKEQFCRENNLSPERPIIGIFPGSRRREIHDLMPIVLAAADRLCRENPQLQFAISRANNVISQALDEVLERSSHKNLVGKQLTLLPVGENHRLMSAADILWTKSGTTTLEAALFTKPMLIFYRGNWVSYWIFLLFKRVKHVGWPNLLCGEQVVPELIQLDCRAENLVRYTRDWLQVPGARQYIASRLAQAKGQLGQGDFAENAAHEIAATLAHPQAG